MVKNRGWWTRKQGRMRSTIPWKLRLCLLTFTRKRRCPEITTQSGLKRLRLPHFKTVLECRRLTIIFRFGLRTSKGRILVGKDNLSGKGSLYLRIRGTRLALSLKIQTTTWQAFLPCSSTKINSSTRTLINSTVRCRHMLRIFKAALAQVHSVVVLSTTCRCSPCILKTSSTICSRITSLLHRCHNLIFTQTNNSRWARFSTLHFLHKSKNKIWMLLFQTFQAWTCSRTCNISNSPYRCNNKLCLILHLASKCLLVWTLRIFSPLTLLLSYRGGLEKHLIPRSLVRQWPLLLETFSSTPTSNIWLLWWPTMMSRQPSKQRSRPSKVTFKNSPSIKQAQSFCREFWTMRTRSLYNFCSKRSWMICLSWWLTTTVTTSANGYSYAALQSKGCSSSKR